MRSKYNSGYLVVRVQFSSNHVRTDFVARVLHFQLSPEPYENSRDRLWCLLVLCSDAQSDRVGDSMGVNLQHNRWTEWNRART